MNADVAPRSPAALYRLINRYLGEARQEPPLAQYLAALWRLAQAHREVSRLSYALLGELLLPAWQHPPVPDGWLRPLLGKDYAYQAEALALVNTPAYFAEIRTYDFFERRIRRQLIELHRMRRGLALPPFVRWENRTAASFLERATYSEDEETDDDLTWGDFAALLGQGQWLE